METQKTTSTAETEKLTKLIETLFAAQNLKIDEQTRRLNKLYDEFHDLKKTLLSLNNGPRTNNSRLSLASASLNRPFEGRLVCHIPHQTVSSVYSLAVLKDGTTIASGSKEGPIRIWNSLNGELLRTLFGHNRTVSCLKALDDGNLASGSYDKTVLIWNPSSGELVRSLSAHTNWIKASDLYLTIHKF